jgi:hypothetical protein
MNINMNDSRLTTISQIKAFLKGNQGVDLSFRDAAIEEKYRLIRDTVNHYYQNYFNPYLNYHRPCAYPTIKTNDKGKTTKVYDHYEVPS